MPTRRQTGMEPSSIVGRAARTAAGKSHSRLDRKARRFGPGTPLSPTQRDYFEGRFGVEFSDVRIHTGSRAAAASDVLGARAYTFGRHIVLGADGRSSVVSGERHLLAHELAHVIQQDTGRISIRRQEIPVELRKSVNYRLLTDTELQERYDLISQTLTLFDQSTPDTAWLSEEAGRIGLEVMRREALASGRTFSPEAIQSMREFFVSNANSANPMNCIACMNEGLRRGLGDRGQRMGSEVHTTMEALRRSGRASNARVIEFNDSRGRLTTGVQRPSTLRENIFDVMLDMAGNDVGWSVFGMSLMDGHHSVTLTLDNNDPQNPRVYWSDQWRSRGGWQEFNRLTLNAEIARWTLTWWDEKPVGRKPRTRTTLWRVNP